MKRLNLLTALFAVTAMVSSMVSAQAGTVVYPNKFAFTKSDFVVTGNNPELRVVNKAPQELYLSIPKLGVDKAFAPSVSEGTVSPDWSKRGSDLKVPYTVSDAAGKVVFSGNFLAPEALIPPALGPALSQETLDGWNRTLADLESNLSRPVYYEYTENKYNSPSEEKPHHHHGHHHHGVKGYW
jgi:hypothetical protein